MKETLKTLYDRLITKRLRYVQPWYDRFIDTSRKAHKHASSGIDPAHEEDIALLKLLIYEKNNGVSS